MLVDATHAIVDLILILLIDEPSEDSLLSPCPTRDPGCQPPSPHTQPSADTPICLNNQSLSPDTTSTTCE